MSSIVLGMALTFAATDGKSLMLTVSLTEPATAAVAWGQLVQTATRAAIRHRFGPLPSPLDAPIGYTVRIAGEPPRQETVPPLFAQGRLRIALYGDSRDGEGPHRTLARAIARAAPDVMIHTGDVVHDAADEAGWRAFLSATLPLGTRSPLILALGNHELSKPHDRRDDPTLDGLERTLGQIPPPDDPIRARTGGPPGAFHVRVGPALIVSLDSQSPLGPGSPQRAFLDAALADRGDAQFAFVAMHQGLLSSGPHGGHEEGEGLLELLARHRVTAVLAGHDHTYERLRAGGITHVVSGGGGAPLYWRARPMPESVAFAATYNWVLIELDGPRATLESYSLEGALLDQAQLAPLPTAPEPRTTRATAARLGAGLALVLGAFGYGLVRLLRGRGLAA